MRVEQGAVMSHVWRERDDLVGPLFTIENGVVRVGGKDLLTLPFGKWVHFEVSAGQGSRANGTWDLAVRLPGEDAKRFSGFKTGSPKWQGLRWLGFGSRATKKTVFYLDNLELTNSTINDDE